MQTYTITQTIEKPRLVIEYDQMPTNPRSNDTNLGYFITVDRNYYSPDKNDTIEAIVKNAGEIAKSVEEHMALIEYGIHEQTKEKVVAIYPVNKFEHSDRIYRLGIAQGFDVSNNGFYIITDKTEEAYGAHAKPYEALIDGELETYTQWANGEVYAFTLYDEDGEVQDGYGDVYDIEECRPPGAEWKNENMRDYLNNN